MSQPRDQPQRTRFISELEKNFSVVASAGSGKTRAITDTSSRWRGTSARSTGSPRSSS